MNFLRQRLFQTNASLSASRVRRRRQIISKISSNVSLIRTILFLVGYLWMLAIPSPRLGRGTYNDENALQAGQVKTHWDWGDVHSADTYLQQLEILRDQNSTSDQRAKFLEREFSLLGLATATQSYEFKTSSGPIQGVNAYAVLSAPRTPGVEAMVITASWLSRTGEGDGTINIRGVASVLALAKFLKRYSHWSKDIILVISDGYLDGMQAWLAAYHGVTQTTLRAESLILDAGVVWTALNIDYPGHSFSHLGVFFEGVNGRLPNQDLINSFKHISQSTGGVPVVLYDHIDFRDHPDLLKNQTPLAFLPNVVTRHPEVQTYFYHARNIARHVKYQALGQPSGVHGLFHQFRIDAITIFALPASGPHGFHAMGRIVESTMRTMNNLLERLHASFFFYILAGSNGRRHRHPNFSHFLKIGSYLPSVILISVAMMFGGLQEWTNAGWVLKPPSMNKEASPKESWDRRFRPLLQPLLIMSWTHLIGGLLFLVIQSPFFILNQNAYALPMVVVFSALPGTAVAIIPFLVKSKRAATTTTTTDNNVANVLRALNCCLASTVISVSAALNFSFAAVLSILLGLPLSAFSKPRTSHRKIVSYLCFSLLATAWIVLLPELVRQAVLQWQVLGVWVLPVACLVFYPLGSQAAIASLL